jgi:histidinol-phosphate aminotransferase
MPQRNPCCLGRIFVLPHQESNIIRGQRSAQMEESHMSNREKLGNGSRRMFLQLSVAATAAAALRFANEPLLAAAAVDRDRQQFPAGSVVINANENPLGPCTEARSAIAAMAAQGGRYSYWLTDELVDTFAKQQGLQPEYIRTFPGSSEPLHFCTLAFTSPTKSYVTADPGYESGMHAAKFSGARVVKVPLTKTYAHDIKAMLAAAPDAGLFYVCTPNNPTGTLTPHSDIEQLVAEKPKGSVVMVDEAYIHFSEGVTALDLVKAGKDVIVLRTFSKIYGMAGIRCGFAIGRPDLLAKLEGFSGWSALPITAVAAATASLKHEQLVPDRKRMNAAIRQKTFDWLASQGYPCVPSQANFFMLDAKRPAKEVIAAMAAKNVFIGRVWPAWPTHVRITVGTQAEMDAFQPAFQAVMKNSTTVGFALPHENGRIYGDGQMWPSV